MTPAAALARFTGAVFSRAPVSAALLALRVALALPFWNSGLAKWDGWFQLSFGAQVLFSDEFKLHLFGGLYPYPAPEFMAYASALAETALPVLIVLGLLTRYAALALLIMTAIIQLTVPDAWQTFHLPWAAMALTLVTFGPGRIALDLAFGIDRAPKTGA